MTRAFSANTRAVAILPRLACATLILLGLNLAHVATAAAGAFVTETVDPRPTAGETVSLAIDPAGEPHIAYHYRGTSTGSNGDLYYASLVSGSWVIEPVDTLGDLGLTAILVFDQTGVPHIAYPDFTLNAMKYASRVNGAWETEIVDQPPVNYYVQGWPGLAFDSNNDPHIAYYVNNVPLFRYASKHAGAWTVEVIAPLQVAQWTGMRIDANDVPHISYSDASGHVRYASKPSGSWQLETIQTLDHPFTMTSLDLDPMGRPWVAFCRLSSSSGHVKDVSLAVRDGGTWTAEVVDSASEAGFAPSLIMDGIGQPHISYYNSGNGVLWYASRASGEWSRVIVDGQQNSGEASSLGLALDGTAWIAYYATDASNQNGQLKVAHKVSGPTATLLSLFVATESALTLVGPNPTPGGIQIHYAVARAGRVRLELVDVSGRVVATLADRIQAPGRYIAAWDGTDRRGRLSPGLYFVRLAAPDRVAVRKLATIR